jgi:hypothetical protein
MSEPAYVEPDEEGHYHLRIAGEAKTFAVERDEHGEYFFVEILPYESLPEHVRHQIEESRRHPERLVEMTLDDVED